MTLNIAPGKLLQLTELTNEQQILLAVARLQLDAENRATLEGAIARKVDWDSLIENARWHKLEGLLYMHLRGERYATSVPAEMLANLRGLYSRNVARYLYYRAELAKVIDELNARGIKNVVLKGGELAEKVYKDHGLRPMVDLDILVPRERSQEAYLAVQRMGYRPVASAEVQTQMDNKDRQLAALAGIDKPIIIEIHTHVVEVDNPLRTDIEKFWSETRADVIAGRPTLTLKPEAEIAYLCYNFFKDRRYYSYSAIGQLCDISEVVRSVGPANINWAELKVGAKFGVFAGPIFCSLLLARGLLAAPIPAEVIDEIGGRRFDVEDARRLARHRVLRRSFVARQLVQPAERKYKLRSALVGAIQRMFPSRSYIGQKYGVPTDSMRIYAYYPLRIAEGLIVGASMVVRPKRFKDEITVDKWLHDLHHSGTAPETGDLISKDIEPGNAKPHAGGKA